MKPSQTRPKARRAYRKSGFHALVRATSREGLSALDGRSSAARAIRQWQAAVSKDLERELSAQERTLLNVAAVDMVLLAAADAWLRQNVNKVVNKRRRTFVPLVEQRLRVATHLTNQLQLLGLRPPPKRIPSMVDLLRR